MELTGEGRHSHGFPSLSCQMGKWPGLRDVCFSVIFQMLDMGWGLENQAGETPSRLNLALAAGFRSPELS